jgi:hypothetical protein
MQLHPIECVPENQSHRFGHISLRRKGRSYLITQIRALESASRYLAETYRPDNPIVFYPADEKSLEVGLPAPLDVIPKLSPGSDGRGESSIEINARAIEPDEFIAIMYSRWTDVDD